MAKKIKTLCAALFALALCSCDGPAEKSLDCATICDSAEKCVGDDFDRSECTDQCIDDASQDAADECQQCLSSEDSCAEEAKCTLACSGVLGAIVFQ
jgi:hypothetical protein